MDKDKDNSIKDTNKDLSDKDRFARFVSLKIEKLCSALYLVTDFLPESEPLKWKLRERAIGLVLESNYDRLISGIGHIVSLFEVAVVGSAVSNMNFSILKSEYLSLKNLLEKRQSGSSLQTQINTAEIEEPKVERVSDNLKPEASLVRYPTPAAPAEIKDINIKDKNIVQKDSRIKDKKNHRQEVIVQFAKNKDWVGITDIAKLFLDCSAKTIQRELADMVQAGVLKKQGEKRWSRYKLA